MSTRMDVYVHHHGLLDSLNPSYSGGKVDTINLDTDLFSFRDLDHFGKEYGYDSSSIVYFKSNGHTFTDGLKIMYDDESVREVVGVSKPYGRIDLYVDHSFDFASGMGDTENEKSDNSGGSDSDYCSETESSEDDCSSLVNSDEELNECRRSRKLFKEQLASEKFRDVSSHESSFESDELRSVDSSSEDEIRRKGFIGDNLVQNKRRKREKLFKEGRVKGGTIKFEVGLKFLSMAEFRTTVRQYGVNERRAVYFAKNDSQRCQVICEEGCPFYIWCTKLKNSENVQIKTLVDNHCCTKPYTNRHATVKYLTGKYGDRIRKDPQWKIKDMIEVIKKEMEIEVPRIKCARVRKAALEGVYDSLKEHYARVRDFASEVLRVNPKNTIKISTTRTDVDSQAKFNRMYVCYHALKEGWKLGCRPILGLDGCFLKTVCGGQLLSAVGRDGNNQMYPVAFAIVESESTDSWRWFLELLVDDLNIGDGYGFTVISDQQKGLENAMKDFMPYAEHRFCTRHLYSNFRKKFPSAFLRKTFWLAATATHPVQHQRAMNSIAKQCRPAYDQLRSLDAKTWTKAHFATTSKADNVENNMSECFNAWIITERYMPVLTMIQEITFKLMTRIKNKRETMLSSDQILCPNIKKKLDLNVTEARNWNATWDGARNYAVKQGGRVVTVDLVNKTCDCRVFQLTGIPCPHAIAAIHDSRQQPMNFVSDFFKRDRYLQSYGQPLEAIKGEEFWEFQTTDPLFPPDIPKKLRGRPKKLRRREEWEGGNRSRVSQPMQQGSEILRHSTARIMHCSVCGGTGHRKNKCPGSTSHVESSEVKGKSKTTTPARPATTDKPKRTYKPRRKACTPWRTKDTSSQA